jgi:hypothetical protein|tara:strand:+ start:937 stop:1110 length:174 start_codon:yes stop_codon:yes gene_type:complete
MKQNYSIEEILSAADEIRNRKKIKKNEAIKNKLIKKDYSSVPKNTIKLIEEAEKIKN